MLHPDQNAFKFESNGYALLSKYFVKKYP